MAWVRTALCVVLTSLCGCLLQLDEEVSCGDRYVHESAREECEPSIPSTYENACRSILGIDRPGACDIETCTVDLSVCTPDCGNGTQDPGEECDPGGPPPDPDSDELAIPGRLCKDLAPLDGGSEYASGTTTRCTEECLWDRLPCTRCGDDSVQRDEICEANSFDPPTVDAYCLGACIEPGAEPRPKRISCRARCASDCQSHVPSDEGLGCCIPTGEPENPHVKCCGFAQDGLCRPGLDG